MLSGSTVLWTEIAKSPVDIRPGKPLHHHIYNLIEFAVSVWIMTLIMFLIIIINTDTVLTCLTQVRNLGIPTMRIQVLSINLVKTNIGIWKNFGCGRLLLYFLFVEIWLLLKKFLLELRFVWCKRGFFIAVGVFEVG